MSEGQEVNKSKEIRDYMEQNPGARPVHVAETLAARGIDVTPAFVSAVNSAARKRGGKTGPRGRPRGRKSAAKKAASSAGAHTRAPKRAGSAGGAAGAKRGLSLDQLIAAKRFAEQMGGIARARAALEALEKISR